MKDGGIKYEAEVFVNAAGGLSNFIEEQLTKNEQRGYEWEKAAL